MTTDKKKVPRYFSFKAHHSYPGIVIIECVNADIPKLCSKRDISKAVRNFVQENGESCERLLSPKIFVEDIPIPP